MSVTQTSKGKGEGDAATYESVSPKPDSKPQSFEDSASTYSRWSMAFMDPLFEKGFSQGIEQEDLGPVSEQDDTYTIYQAFWKHWKQEELKPEKKRDLWSVLWRTIGYKKIAYPLSLYFIFSALQFIPVLILNSLVKHFEGETILSETILWVYVALMFIVPMFSSIIAVRSNNILVHIGAEFRNALVNAIYRKTMCLSPAARQASSTGQIINMFAADTRQIQAFLFFINNSVLAPLQIAAALALIYFQVGYATFVGLGFMFAIMPFNAWFFTTLTFLQKKRLTLADARVKLMNEVLSGVRIIKYYAWEVPFEGQVTKRRSMELQVLKQIAYVVACGFTLILLAVPIVQPILVFYTYVQLGYELDAATAFTTLALFNIMQLPFAFLPMGLSTYAQSLVSCDRMMKFFAAQELEDYILDLDEGQKKANIAVSIKDASMHWIEETDEIRRNFLALEVKSGNEKLIRDGSYIIGDHVISKGEESKTWSENLNINRSCHTLLDMNVEIKKGELVAVVGPVGCGKSSFLSGLLGEMSLGKGSVSMEGSIAYCNQQPWVLNETVKDNILFGKEYEEKRFDQAVFASSLEDDIRILPGGVLTEIGEKGINLSGGQKARVSLARAVYRNADIYLLDDPLSAVDAHVAEHLFSECITKQLKGKTRVLVTHHVHLLSKCDRIIILDHGKIKATGSFQELQNSGVDISSYIEAKGDLEEDTSTSPMEQRGERTRTSSSSSSVAAKPRSMSSLSASSETRESKERSMSVSSQKSTSSEKDKDKAKADQKKNDDATERHGDDRASKLTTIEERKLGDVTWDTYVYYLRSGGWGWFVGGLTCQLIAQGFQVFSSFWLSTWGAETVEKEGRGETMTTDRSVHYLNYFALWCMVGLALTFGRAILIAQHRVTTSATMHQDLLRSVMAAPVWFFDVTPTGRIMNRFSSDMQVVDSDLSQTISQITNSMFGVLGAVGAVAAATKGAFLLLMLPLGYVYSKIQTYFRKTNTTVARLSAVSRSPILADFSQALSGINSIRAYNDSGRFIAALEAKVNNNTISEITQQLAGQWLAIRLDIIGAVISGFIACLAVATRDTGFIPAGYLALGLTYSFQITSFLKFAVKVLASGEAQMNSVERIMYYCTEIQPEELLILDSSTSTSTSADKDNSDRDSDKVTYRVVSSESKEAQIDSDKKMASDAGTADLTATDGGESGGGGGMGSTGSSSGMEFMLNKALMYDLKHEQVASDMKKYANWPTEGKIEFRKISMQYHTGPLVLKDLDIVVEGGQKIGIAGRTGSGKSSLMVTLFRIQELTGGAILIDGIDIATVPLAILRAKLGIIPQDPVMFSMNVRFNLDPFDLYTDLELYDALESVNMRTHVDSLPGRLNEMVAEGGENFSAGQRQLICIARALLRKPKILVLDEATASIDNETDVFIQEMVRNAFKNCTVLTIAHRLHTIVDSDKILVLDHGNTAEFDSPKTLLAKDKGDFKSLWAQHTASHQGNVAVSKSNENLASLVTDKNDKVTDKNDKASKGKAKGKK